MVLNAIQATKPGGTVTIRTRAEAAEVSLPNGMRSGNQWRKGDLACVIEVEDNGSGIPEESLASVFDPFFTAKPTGEVLGLGLTLVRKITRSEGQQRRDLGLGDRQQPGGVFTPV